MDTEAAATEVVAPNGASNGVPAGEATEVVVPSGDPVATSGSGKNITIPSRAFQARLTEAKESGKKAAAMELDKKAQDAGFTSFDAMLAHMAGTRGQPSKAPAAASPIPTPPVAPSNRQDRRAMMQYQKEVDRYKREVDKAVRAAADAQRISRDLQRKLHAREAQADLEKAAMAAGVKDIDFAVHLLKQSLEGKTEAELKAFDENKFFADLRSNRPYLFGETVRPASTGTGASVPTTTPNPGQVDQRTGASGQVDARTMKTEEFNNYLRKKGINPSYEG
jgi:hypothetical protein